MRSDVLVIGAGVIGLSCAWRLEQGGAKVTLCEKKECGSGASGAALGALWPPAPSHKDILQQQHRTSLWHFESFAEEIKAVSGIDVGYIRCGRLELLQSEAAKVAAEIDAEIVGKEWPAIHGLPAWQILDSTALKDAEPYLMRSSHGAVFCRATAKVAMRELIDGLKECCVRSGVTIIENTEVLNLKYNGSRVSGIKTAEGKIACGAVLVAAGVWTPLLGRQLQENAPVTPVRGQAVCVGLDEHPLRKIVKSGSIYLVPNDGKMITIGSTTEPHAGFSENTTDDAIATLISNAEKLFPAICRGRVLRTWAGLRPKPKGNRPFIGAVPGLEGLYVATGHYKIGVGMAPLTGRIISELILRST